MTDREVIAGIIGCHIDLCMCNLKERQKDNKYMPLMCMHCKYDKYDDCLLQRCADEVLKVIPMLDIYKKLENNT